MLNVKESFIMNSVKSASSLKKIIKVLKRDKYKMLLVFPGFALMIIFSYGPMYGILIAFQKYKLSTGIFGSEWVGLKYFMQFFKDPYFFRILFNTVRLSVLSIAIGFPMPIILALLFNEVKNARFKKLSQTISYMPTFVSVVIIVGILKEFFSYDSGIVNNFLEVLGMKRIIFFTKPFWFVVLYLGSGIWQGVGMGSVLYLATISNVNAELYQAAVIDGASRIQRIVHITVPAILPVIAITFILNMGGILGSDFAKILLMYNASVYEVADVISTYVYRRGLINAEYSYSTAVGLFTGLVGFLFVFTTNLISRKVTEYSLW